MKQVSIGTVAIILVAALMAGFVAGRYFGQSHKRDDTAAASTTNAAEADVEGRASAEADTAIPGAAGDGEQPPALTPATPANTASGSAGKVATTATGMQASGGPRTLPEEDLKRFDRWRAMIRANGGVWADLLELSETEEQDDGARRLEQLLADAFRRHGSGYTELYIAPPHCTRSVCILRAVGLGGATRNPRSNWQALFRKVAAEPWYRQAFDDSSVGVAMDGEDTLYHATLVRCEPGSCRFANR